MPKNLTKQTSQQQYCSLRYPAIVKDGLPISGKLAVSLELLKLKNNGMMVSPVLAAPQIESYFDYLTNQRRGDYFCEEVAQQDFFLLKRQPFLLNRVYSYNSLFTTYYRDLCNSNLFTMNQILRAGASDEEYSTYEFSSFGLKLDLQRRKLSSGPPAA